MANCVTWLLAGPLDGATHPPTHPIHPIPIPIPFLSEPNRNNQSTMNAIKVYAIKVDVIKVDVIKVDVMADNHSQQANN